MSNRTVLNTSYKGLVETFAIPAELHKGGDKTFASFASAIPIHCCTPQQVEERAKTTHHYCDVFTDQTLAPLDELVYVRLDDTTAEKVFINRTKRLLLLSSDGVLAQWRCAASFESANLFVAGTPIVNKEGELVSVITAKRGNHYAVSSSEGEGGYFSTPRSWKTLDTPEGYLVYADRHFPSREELREYIGGLPPLEVTADSPPTPVLHQGPVPRIALVAQNGRQISHMYLHGVHTTLIEYL